MAENEGELASRLSALGLASYHDYLRTEHWLQLRLHIHAVRKRCEACGDGSMLQVHHKTYERLGYESDGDLCLLCRQCHDDVHGLAAQIGDLQRATAVVLARARGWTKETVDDYLKNGGSVKRVDITAIDADMLYIPEDFLFQLSEQSPPQGCVCCGRLKGHRHWCIHNPTIGPPIGPDDGIGLEKPIVNTFSQGCERCGGKLHNADRTICVKCILKASKPGQKLCLFCGEEIYIPRRKSYSGFLCATCRNKNKK